MMKKPKLFLSIVFFGSMLNLFSQTYTMPSEEGEHEGTWLQWPHQYEYGTFYRNSLDESWVEMTDALVQSENVHIIAYNNTEKNRIIALLTNASVDMSNVDFFVYPTNDVWVRDNGPIFAKDVDGNIVIEDWGFNGWGGKYNFNHCNPIPSNIGNELGSTIIDLNSTMVCEGGAYEIDGNGALMACRSSILSQSPSNTVRNSGMTQSQAETIMTNYLGVSKFIWLDGVPGSDITDTHIDGFAKFINGNTIVTMNNTDLEYWGIPANDISTLYNATDVDNVPYTKVYVPLTQNDVSTTNGQDLGYKGSYCNYYIGNTVVLVPNYNDPNDAVANSIIQGLHPGRTVVGIDVRNLYEYGGMVHCVTQQQPIANQSTNGLLNKPSRQDKNKVEVFPNPCYDFTTIQLRLDTPSKVKINIYNSVGLLVVELTNSFLSEGQHSFEVNAKDFENGVYNFKILINDVVDSDGNLIIIQ